MDIKKLIGKLLKKKTASNSAIDIDAYSHGLKDMFNELANSETTPQFGDDFIAYHPEGRLAEHCKAIKDAEEYIMKIEGDGSEGFSEEISSGGCWIAKKIKISSFVETSNSESADYCNCGENEYDEDECPSCKRERWPHVFDSIGHIEFHNVK